MKNFRNFIKNFNYSSKISHFIIFILTFCLFSCKKSSEQLQHSETTTNQSIIEKINETPNSKEKTNIINENKSEEIQAENYAKDLLDAIEFNLQLQEKFKNLKIESEEDFLSDEEIELLSPGNISQYINALFQNDELYQEAISHILKSSIMNSANINDIKRIYNMIGYEVYDTAKNHENIKILHDYAKNIGDADLLNILYKGVLDSIARNENPYSARVLCLQLSELYQNDPEKKQEIELNFYKKNEIDTPYEKIEKNFDNFLKNANQNYESYNEALKFLSQQKTIEQTSKIINYDYGGTRYFRGYIYQLDEKYLYDLKNRNQKSENILKKIEYLEKYHTLYSNIYQQIKETYQK